MTLEPAWFHNWRIRQVQVFSYDVRIDRQLLSLRPLFYRCGFESMTRRPTISRLRFVATPYVPWLAILAFALSLTATAILVGLLVSSLAAVESTARLSLDLPGRTLLGVQLVDPVTGEKVPIRDGVVTLKPFQTLVGRLGE